MKTQILSILIIFLSFACSDKETRNKTGDGDRHTAALHFEIRRTLEHDPKAFTQGLVFYKGNVLESTGGDDSWIAEYNISTGNYGRKIPLESQYFGEGITVLNNKIYQLTWKSKIGFIYDVNTFERIGEFSYNHEGWGITHDGVHLIISDGSHQLHYLDTLNLKEKITKTIKYKGRRVNEINELEYIDGYIYANQWQTNYILKIDPEKSEVIERLDFTPIVKQIKKSHPHANVLNGIAHNPKTGEILITGKNWPFMFLGVISH